MCKKQKYDCRKRDYWHVRGMAEKFPVMIGSDVRFFYTRDKGITYYDFEPAAMDQHLETTLELFKA